MFDKEETMAHQGQSVATLKERLQRPSADDVVAAVFAFASGEKELFSNDRYMLQSFFYGLYEQERFRRLLTGFDFTTDRDIFPFSRELEAALGRLQMGHRIYAKNPEYTYYGMPPEERQKMEDRASAIFKDDEVELLREAGTAFRSFADEWDKAALAHKGGRIPEASERDA
jgi:hypothetical protein